MPRRQYVPYEQMIEKLHGLLGEEVRVSFWVDAAGSRPLGSILGTLRRANETDLSQLEGVQIPLPAGETLTFFVGAGTSTAGVFHLTRATYKLGEDLDG